MEYLQKISQKVANHKKLVVQTTWHNFFDHVADHINSHEELQNELFDTSAEYFAEELSYRELSSKSVRSNIIKTYLHEILTNAIFNYSPCKDLLDVFDETVKPKQADWESDTIKWLYLSAEPFQYVSVFYLNYFTLNFIRLKSLFL